MTAPRTALPFELPFALPFSFALAAAVAVLAGCAATTGPDQLAARECKVAAADFANKPKKDPTAAEKAEAELKVSRLAWQRGGYANGNNVFADAMRDCER